jgi:hypothetical protein
MNTSLLGLSHVSIKRQVYENSVKITPFFMVKRRTQLLHLYCDKSWLETMKQLSYHYVKISLKLTLLNKSLQKSRLHSTGCQQIGDPGITGMSLPKIAVHGKLQVSFPRESSFTIKPHLRFWINLRVTNEFIKKTNIGEMLSLWISFQQHAQINGLWHAMGTETR